MVNETGKEVTFVSSSSTASICIQVSLGPYKPTGLPLGSLWMLSETLCRLLFEGGIGAGEVDLEGWNQDRLLKMCSIFFISTIPKGVL